MRPARWVNTAPDENGLPALLLRVAARFPVDALDELWIFPTTRAADVESTVIVISTFSTDDEERREVSTARFTATRDRKGQARVEERMHQHALATVDAVARVVEGVLRRSGEDLHPPRHERIARDAARWIALLETSGAAPAELDAAREAAGLTVRSGDALAEGSASESAPVGEDEREAHRSTPPPAPLG